MPGGHYPIAYLCIHPRQLYTRHSGTQQSIARINADVISGTMDMPQNNTTQYRKQLLQQAIVACRGQVVIQRVEHPERSIDRIVLRSLAAIGETVGYQALMHK